MRNKVLIYLLSAAAMLHLQISAADDFLDLLNSEANAVPESKENSEEKIVTDKVTKPTIPLTPENKTKTKDDFSDLINLVAGSDSDAKHNSKEETVTEKVSTSNSSFIPKNKTKKDYDAYLKDNFPKTYRDYIKLSDQKQSFIYTKYVKQSFPRIEEAQEIIKRFLKK
jgi:hypothetical protein